MPKPVPIKIKRPRPPMHLLPEFAPDEYFRDWLIETFLDPKSPLYNPEHDHLSSARLGVLWSSVENSRHGRRIVGMAELASGIGGTTGKWAKARAQFQLLRWFGEEVDFLLTFDAEFMDEASDATFCAVAEHELYHCAQAMKDGIPQFSTTTGRPKFAIRGHDVEEFVGIVWRYGAAASAQGELIESMAKAAMKKPAIGEADVKFACGACAG